MAAANSILDNEEDARDAVCEAARRAWMSLDNVRETGNAGKWFLAIARNEAKRLYMRNRDRAAAQLLPGTVCPLMPKKPTGSAPLSSGT